MEEDPLDGATAILRLASTGDRDAINRLITMVYGELKKLASAKLGGGQRAHSLNTTALVHEAYFRLIEQKRTDWKNRAHFLGIAAKVIRRVLLDHVRRCKTDKSGGGHDHLSIVTDLVAPGSGQSGSGQSGSGQSGSGQSGSGQSDIIAIDKALSDLEELNPRQAEIVELRFFAGMTVAECAGVLDISKRTVDNDWRMARAYLMRVLSDGDAAVRDQGAES